jgi:ATP-dependent DNA ligase
MRPVFIEPMLPTLAEEPPKGDDWIHEIKHDGYRSELDVRAETTLQRRERLQILRRETTLTKATNPQGLEILGF